MKAMILAAGKGTRVRPLTYELPKPMIPILGKPLMAYLIEHLARYGVKEIMVNVSWLHGKIEEYFGDGQHFGVEIGYSFEGEVVEGEVSPVPLGAAGGMRKIQDLGGFFDETTLVLCGDALIDLDLKSALFEHRRRGAMASVVTRQVPWEQVSNYGIVVADEAMRVTSFQEKPSRATAKSNLASTGIYILEPQVLDLVPSRQFFDIGNDLFPLLVEKGLPFYAQQRFFNWIDIGHIADYWAVLQRVLVGEVAQMEMPGRELKPGVWVGLNVRVPWEHVTINGPVYLGSGTEIGAGARIMGPTWIGHGSRIGCNAKVSRSVLFEYVQVEEGVSLDEVVVYGDYCVNRQGETTHLADTQQQPMWGDARGK